MWNDPIVEETRKIRDQLAAKFNYDVQELGQYYITQQASGDRKVVSRPVKKVGEEREKVA